MDEAQLNEGLELYVAGDLLGAAKVWLPLHTSPLVGQWAHAYLRHLHGLLPEVVTAAAVKLGVAQFSPDPAPLRRMSLNPPRGSAVAVMAQAESMPSLPAQPFAVPPPSSDPECGAPSAKQPGEELMPADAFDMDQADVNAALEGIDSVPMRKSTASTLEHPSEDSARVSSAAPLGTWEDQLRGLLELDDFSGALKVAESILRVCPDHSQAIDAQKQCEQQLQHMLRAKLSNGRGIPQVLVPADQIIWLDLDHRAGFVLSQVDGVSTYDEIVEVTGMERLESYRLLTQLLDKGIIGSQ